MKERVAEFFLLLQGFRKFLICLLVLVVAIIFRAKSLVSGGEFVDLAKAVTLGFFGTNSMEGLFSVVKEHLQTRKEGAGVLVTPKDHAAEPDDEVTIVPTGDSK